MAFLNHATNNIIIDAVLTEKGRELLAQNRNAFQITKFAFGDDEVDYSLITKYGLRVGKEKIEKNTPVFEALTGQNISLKYPLFTATANLTDFIKHMPVLERTDQNGNTLLFKTQIQSLNFTLKTTVADFTINNTLTPQLQDTTFSVYYDNRFIKTSQGTAIEQDNFISYVNLTAFSPQNIALEFIGQKEFQFKLTYSSMLNSDTFDRYGYGNNKEIRTQIHVVGAQSGASITIPVTVVIA